ncbi:MAG: hybrid sensor histidine kinase/response regulator [Burkholderiales bacterium]|jgi:signal transduction histidine kinase
MATESGAERGAAGAALPESAEQEILNGLARQARSVPAPVVLAALVAAGAMADAVPMGLLVVWVGAVAAIQALRWRRIPALAADTSRPEVERLREAARLSLANGCVHASIGLVFPMLGLGQRAVVTMILVGLASGTVVSSAGWRAMFRGFALPIFGVLALMWASLPADELGVLVRLGIAALIVVLYLLLQGLADSTSAALRETFEIRRREVGLRAEQLVLNERLQAALADAQAANRAKTRFLASASHDLRQPLHALLLFSAALAMRPLDGKSKEIAGRIDDATQALAHELDTLLDVSKLDAGAVRVTVERVDAGALAERLAQTMAPLAHRKGLALECHAQPGLWVDTDRGHVERVLRNLVDNAIKYTGSGSVTLCARRVGGRVAWAVTDTGPGIPRDEHARIFEEFYQIGNPERDRQQGLGLGLAIVRRLVDLLGGRLVLDSTPGRGSTFELSMPAAEVIVETVADPGTGSARPLDGVHVMVVDDEASVRLGTQLLLEGFGCRVTLVRDSDEAVEIASEDPPDVVLADMRLEGRDSGVRAVNRLRALRPGLPALLVSGDTAPDRLREARDAALPLLHKPVPADLLARSIAEALEART